MRKRTVVVITVLLVGIGGSGPAQGQESPTSKQMDAFLRSADVVESRRTSKGLTQPWRLTLSDGQTTNDALFQSVNTRRNIANFKRGSAEINFVDSYAYNIAAYRLAGLLGLDDMIPVTVERRWNGERGAVSWWVDAEWDEGERKDLGLQPPSSRRWNRQMYRVLVFSALIQDSDRNVGNMLISEEWKVWMIDFTRAFRLAPELHNVDALRRCDRELLASLRALRKEQVRRVAADHLSGLEIDLVMTRRDLLVEHFEQLIAERGEDKVLYR
jgi:hypothetical protein